MIAVVEGLYIVIVAEIVVGTVARHSFGSSNFVDDAAVAVAESHRFENPVVVVTAHPVLDTDY